jgi:hypothetical protein
VRNKKEIEDLLETLCKLDKKGLMILDSNAKFLESYINYDIGELSETEKESQPI